MKREYKKPEIMFESFVLSTHIAGDCNIIINNATVGVCGYLDERDPTGVSVFTAEVLGCGRKEVDGYNSICYHNPTDTTDLFAS